MEDLAWNPARQCTGTNREGERCRRQPIRGGTVCVMHGGSIPAEAPTPYASTADRTRALLAGYQV